MAGTFQDNGDGTTTVSFAYTGVTDKLLSSVLKVAQHIHANPSVNMPYEEVAWGDLTNQQKLDIVDWDVRRRLIAMRDSLVHREYDDAANVDAAIDIENNYDL